MKIETEELKALIPSEDVRKHIVETNYEFNDWQKAALFYHRELPLERYEAKVNTEKTVAGVRDNFLIEASNLYKGKSALDSLYYWGTEYRKIKRGHSE